MRPTRPRNPFSRLAAVMILVVATALAPSAGAEQAGSLERRLQAGQIDAGFGHTCAVLPAGAALCWGLDADGQLGDGATTVGSSGAPTPVSLPSGRRAVSISTGGSLPGSHTCAILDDGSAYCWGRDANGQLGDGTTTTGGTTTPTQVNIPAGRHAVAVTAGGQHSCAILDDGRAVCWGRDNFGQLGNGGINADATTPSDVSLPPGRTAAAISAGDTHTCAVLDNGAPYCWGDDFDGQLGDGATTTTGSATPTPVSIAAPRRAVAISAGGSFSGGQHSCAILDDGSATCWGFDGSGQLGNDPPTLASTVPTPTGLPSGRRAVALSAGGDHSCVTLDNGDAMCWGSDTSGQLGDNPPPSSISLPAAVALSGRSALALAAGTLHTCAVLDTGAGVCWGSDISGRLGDGGAETSTGVPSSTAALSIGSMTTRVADLSLGIDAVPTTVALGGAFDTVVRVGNAGPDSATGVRVTLTPTLLQVASANAGQGTLSGLVWDVGTVVAGGQALLFLKMSAPTAGAAHLRAEMTASEVVDPDSKPNNGVATEDDQAQVAITVTAPAATPPATPTALKLSKFSLSSKTFRSKGLRGTRKVGTQIRFTLSVAAKVTVTIERKVAGKFKKAGSFSFNAKAGKVSRTFTGVIGKKPLAKGAYRMRIKATAGARSATLGPVVFTIATK